MARQDKVVVLAVLFVFAALIGAACSDSRSTREPDPGGRVPFDFLSQPFGEQEAIAFIGSPLPAGATDVHVTGESALDTIVLARFDAPREDVVAWLAELGLTESLEPGYSPFYSSGPSLREAANWREAPPADSTEVDYSGLYQQVGAKYYSVVVTPLENGLVRVHLLVHNT